MSLLQPAAVTVDVFSALIDSRRGGTAALGRLGAERGWTVDPGDLYDAWDGENKRLHLTTTSYASFRTLARQAMARAQQACAVDSDPQADADALLASMPTWPCWPDSLAGLEALSARHRVALLSNIDDDLLAGAAVTSAVEIAITSEQARAYKPHAALYRHAEQQLGSPLLHVASSARDVRGALEAGLAVVRLRRPGHELDPHGPLPPLEADDLSSVAGLVR
ncbi:MAG: HAD-IA family hydrolase [Nitriliruptorales bacterium]|nr:HAD-IA family hydrolase [Nitriliruptorales bacterium]